MPVPTLTAEQRDAALTLAKQRRQQRAALLAAVKRGDVSLSALLEQADSDPNGVVGRTRVLVLLRALPGVGSLGAQRLMSDLGISLPRRVRGLGERQRKLLVAAAKRG